MSKILLYGMRCSGKTTLGSRLAADLDLPFSDLDSYIARSVWQPLSSYIPSVGWDVFRDAEHRALWELLDLPWDAVISLGGGAIISERNQDLISSRDDTICIYLEVAIETIASRLEQDQRTREERPSLTGRDPIDEIREVYMARRAIYESQCRIRISNDGSEDTAITEIHRCLADM